MSDSNGNHDQVEGTPAAGPSNSAYGLDAEALRTFNEALYDQVGDPNPPPPNATQEIVKSYKQELEQYSKEMMDAFRDTGVRDEVLWFEFTSSFRPESFGHMSKATAVRWVNFLYERGVWVRRQQGYRRARALIDCLEQPAFVPAQNNPTTTIQPDPAVTPLQAFANEQQARNPGENRNNVDAHHPTPTQTQNNSNPEQPRGDLIETRAVRQTEENIRSSDRNPTVARTSLQNVLPNVCENSLQITRHGAESQRLPDRTSTGYPNGFNSMLKACQNRCSYGGGFDEDLQGAIDFYDSMARLCRLSDEEKAAALPAILCDDALSFYMKVYRVGDSYESILQKLVDNYINAEQRNRSLILWQSMRLSQAMRESPEKSELDVFRSFCHKLGQLQNQLDPAYRTDNFLRDQLVVSADTPQISQSLRERVPATSQEARSRIATFLSSEPKSAEAFTVSNISGSSTDDKALYSLGNRYGGEARKTLRGFGRRKRDDRRGRKISPRWLAGKKGCYVCGENHLARTRHSQQEIKEAIEKMKSQRPSAYLTVEDLSHIVEDLTTETNTVDDANLVCRGESDGSDSDEDSEEGTAYIVEDEMSLHELDEVYLANASFIHGTGFHKDLDIAMSTMEKELKQGECDAFRGLHIDTCANKSSVMSYAQYKAYCEQFNVPCCINRDNVKRLRGIGGNSQPIGTATIPVPFKDLNLVIDVTFQIVRDNVPSLLSMKDMVDNGLEISLQRREVMYKHLRQPLTFSNYFLIHTWCNEDLAFSLYTDVELRKLHRVFGHPNVNAFLNFLKRARPMEMNAEVRKAIEELTKSCVTCTVNASRPRRFKLTIGTEDLRFNHTVAVDVMYINQKPILHAVDEATHFNAALFLRRMTSSEVWKSFIRCWSRLYLGPPDFLRIDQGSNFVSREFLELSEADGITVLPAPIESPSTMTHVERYHGPLRVAYLKLRSSLPRNETDADCLQLAIKSVNDTLGPEGLCPTLLVFGAIPRPARQTPAETQLQRARAVDVAMDAVRKEQAKRRLSFGLKHYNGPKGKEQSKELETLPAGAPVYIFREASKKWEGPHTFIHVDGETVVVQLPHGRRIFRSSVVKPANGSHMRYNVSDDRTGNDTALFGADAEGVDAAGNNSQSRFREARMKEIMGLRKRGTFEIVNTEDIPTGTRIYGSKWVDLVKSVDGKDFLKSRLVAQNYMDRGALDIATKSPTVSRLGQRMAIALSVLFPDHTPYVRDISQAYIQSESLIERKVFVRPPPEMGLESGKVLRVVKPLYGIPESGLHWFLTYHTHHVENLFMTPTMADTCVLYRRSEENLDGVTILQVDDSFGHGNKNFLDDEERCSKKFESKPRTCLQEGDAATFNGVKIQRKPKGYLTVSQSKKLRSLVHPRSAEQFVSVRAQAQYIGCCTRPDISAAVQLLAGSVNEPQPIHFRKLKAVVDRCHETADTGLTFVPLDHNSVRLMLFTDASFANADRMKSQLGFVLLLADENNRANIIHYGSSRCRRVARSVMAAEIHALVYGFDQAFVAKHMIEEILGKEIGVDGFVDSRTVFNVVAKNGPTLEKRLHIDVSALKESHKRGELRYLAWIPGEQNIADGLTKGLVGSKHPLWNLMKTNNLYIRPSGWVEGSRVNPASI